MPRKQKSALQKAREAYVELSVAERAVFRQAIDLADELNSLPPVGARRQRTARKDTPPAETKAE
jgi:hypothetical protein